MSTSPASTAPTVLQVRRTLPASREEVFRAWTDPDLVPRWFTPRGGSSAGAEMDVRVGGRYRWGMKLLGHLYYAVGEYIEVDPPKRIVCTFGWERALVRLSDSLLTVEFADRGDETEVVITHERLRNRRLRALHGAGWRACLANLGRCLARGRPASTGANGAEQRDGA